MLTAAVRTRGPYRAVIEVAVSPLLTEAGIHPVGYVHDLIVAKMMSPRRVTQLSYVRSEGAGHLGDLMVALSYLAKALVLRGHGEHS